MGGQREDYVGNFQDDPISITNNLVVPSHTKQGGPGQSRGYCKNDDA